MFATIEAVVATLIAGAQHAEQKMFTDNYRRTPRQDVGNPKEAPREALCERMNDLRRRRNHGHIAPFVVGGELVHDEAFGPGQRARASRSVAGTWSLTSMRRIAVLMPEMRAQRFSFRG